MVRLNNTLTAIASYCVRMKRGLTTGTEERQGSDAVASLSLRLTGTASAQAELELALSALPAGLKLVHVRS